jgi:uncharacterized protein
MSDQIVISATDLKIVQDILASCLPRDSCHVFVFGSRVKGTKKRFADLDLAFDLGRPLTRAEQLHLSEGFEDSDLSYKVDIVDLQTISANFANLIRPDLVELELTAIA